jgi:hypothetical protein
VTRFLLLLGAALVACNQVTSGGGVILFHDEGQGQFASEYFDIPSATVLINYTGTGDCRGLGFRLFAESDPADNVDTPTVTSPAADVAGQWPLTVKPGRYALGGGLDGCAWTVNVQETAP